MLQRRKGHGGGGLTSLLIGTLDNVLDTKVDYKYMYVIAIKMKYDQVAASLRVDMPPAYLFVCDIPICTLYLLKFEVYFEFLSC